MIFKRSNGPFGCVASMDARRNKLIVHLLLLHEFLQGGRAFIVEALKLWTHAGKAQGVVGLLIGLHNGVGLAVGDGFGNDGIAVVIIQDEDVVVACAGGCTKRPV